MESPGKLYLTNAPHAKRYAYRLLWLRLGFASGRTRKEEEEAGQLGSPRPQTGAQPAIFGVWELGATSRPPGCAGSFSAALRGARLGRRPPGAYAVFEEVFSFRILAFLQLALQRLDESCQAFLEKPGRRRQSRNERTDRQCSRQPHRPARARALPWVPLKCID